MKKIPFGRPMIGDEEKNAVLQVLSGDILVHGPRSKEFENAFSAFTKAPFALSTSSCTASLHLAYFYLGTKPGDEVIVPAETHVATAHAVELTGAKPVFVDADAKTGNIDIDQIEAAITPRTRAISVVHFLGMPVAMDKVTQLAKKHELFLVEDCALAVGAKFQGTHVGLFGDIGCFSFYPVKHMTTSEGGMILTNQEKIAQRITRQKAFGVDKTLHERTVPGVYDVTMLGFNYRMSELEAAIGIEQVKKLPTFLQKRRENFTFLESKLKEIPEVSLLESTHGDFESSYYCLSFVLNPKLISKRVEIISAINAHGVGTSVHYPHPVPLLSYYQKKYGYALGAFPQAERISYGSIALSVGPHLNVEDMAYTAKAIKEVIAKVK